MFFIALFMLYTVVANYFVIMVMNSYDLYPVPSLVLMIEQVNTSSSVKILFF